MCVIYVHSCIMINESAIPAACGGMRGRESPSMGAGCPRKLEPFFTYQRVWFSTRIRVTRSPYHRTTRLRSSDTTLPSSTRDWKWRVKRPAISGDRTSRPTSIFLS